LKDLLCFGQEQAEYEILEEQFMKFDDQFEYGSQLPAIFLR